MANKNTAGNTLVRSKTREERLVHMIDKRSKEGANDNLDSAYNNYTINEEGARTWSF